ncbi:MAG: phenylalanine--tRNA ligase subunit alpha, partial [Schwartzia sp.]|nr:phenylalanine--tRNA ligase subunit alpha [Schwartzia sp. (in: firmicutes)]
MEEKIRQLMQDASEVIKRHADSLSELNEARVKYLGKKGEITSLLRGLKELGEKERPRIGQIVNEARRKLEVLVEEKT